MNISFYKRVEGDQKIISCTADIDLSKIRAFSLINRVIRRKDGYIRRFSKCVQISFHPPYTVEGSSCLFSLDKMYLDPLKAYAKEAGGFNKTKDLIVERKLTRRGMVDRKAINWHWEREV
jgi:hypothetical protein